MTDIIIQNVTQVAATLLITLIGVLGAWRTTKLAKKEELKNITAATNELVSAAQITVLELQQTTVDGWKEIHADGKLTDDEKKWLGKALLDKTKEKMSVPAMNLLTAAGVDVNAIITGAGESMIRSIKEAQ